MKKDAKKTRNLTLFEGVFIIIAVLFTLSVVKTRSYNKTLHRQTYSGDDLFGEGQAKSKSVSVKASARTSTWTKAFDLNNEGITEHNYQASTYDFYITNGTGDEVSDYSFRLTFNKEIFLLSAWNGALELHQNVGGDELISTIPDLREYNADDYDVETVIFDGEVLVVMDPGDYLIKRIKTVDS